MSPENFGQSHFVSLLFSLRAEDNLEKDSINIINICVCTSGVGSELALPNKPLVGVKVGELEDSCETVGKLGVSDKS
jgi:hypothetical protein